MPISGLVITLAEPEHADELRKRLESQEPRLSWGELQINQLPAVLETDSAQGSQTVHDWLLSQPGVVNVDVVFVGLE